MRIEACLPTNAPLAVLVDAGPPPAAPVSQTEWCGRVASDIQRSRTLRRRLLPDLPVGEGIWDMLLDLYLCERKGVRLSISDLALAADVPRSTGARLVGALIDGGTLCRTPDLADGRRTWVMLSPPIRSALERYFIELVPGAALDAATAMAAE